MHVDFDSVSSLLRMAAEEEVLPKWRSLAHHEIEEKRSGELVTVVDVAVERRLTVELKDLLPGSQVVGEEAAEHDPLIFEHLAQEDDPVWIIDPIDGTGNFSKGSETFAMMLALIRRAEIDGAWILDPVSGRLAVAEHGGGAYLEGRRCEVTQAPSSLQDFRGPLLAGFFGNRELGQAIQARREKVSALKSLRCAGHEYLRLIGGEADFALYTKTKPWDHAPGVLLHREAGGTGRFFDGRPYDVGVRDAEGLLCAPNPEAWALLRERLLP